MFRYLGAARGAVTWEDIQQVDEYLREQVTSHLNLPREFIVRHFKTDTYQLFPRDETVYKDDTTLAWVGFGMVDNFNEHITLVEGEYPSPVTSEGQPINILVSQNMAFELGMQTGEIYVVFIRGSQATQDQQLQVRVSGLWEPTNPKEPYWFYEPDALDDFLIVPEETYAQLLSRIIDQPVYLGLWYLVMNGDEVRAENVRSLLGRITFVQQRVITLLPNTSLTIAPTDPLVRYQSDSGLLTVLLYAFSVPIMGLILAFIGLVVGLLVERQRNEIAVLRSRGATMPQIIGIALIEGLFLSLFALAISLPGSQAVAYIIGQTRSFLSFDAQTDIIVRVTNTAIRLGGLAVGVTLAAQLLPTIGAARHTIISYKQDQARSLKPPWWQRAWLDVLLLIPAGYGTYILQQQGQVAMPGTDGFTAEDPFENPLLFLIPALGIFALTLFTLRFVPFIMGLLAWILSQTKSVSLLLALRQLSRTPGFYSAPLVLLVLTLSLSAFTSSLAQTLDYHLYDQKYYDVGSDLRFKDYEIVNTGSAFAFGESGGGGGNVAVEEDAGPQWYFFPYQEYLNVDGVRAVTRVGRYRARTRTGGRTRAGLFLGVSRNEFPATSYWRHDFAGEPLGNLMNKLALVSDGALVPREFMIDNALREGDLLRVNLDMFGETLEMAFTIVGTFEYFPTWYPEIDPPLVVGNLDHIFQQVGGQMPYEVWLKTRENTNLDQVIAGLDELNFRVQIDEVTPQEILEEQERPERQGLFGVLSVGFIGAALLTVLGFLLYAFFSFRRRFIELGTLRAVGMSAADMTNYIFWELAFLILIGLGMGTGLGALVSYIFIPALQVGSEETAQIPPLLG